MESSSLSQPEFKEFAKDVVLFCHITTRIPGEKNDDLLGKMGGRGFPYLIYMDADGQKVGEVPGRDVASFQKGMQVVGRYVELSAKSDPTQDEKVELLALKANLGKVDLKGAESERAAMGELTAEQAKRLDGAIAELKIADMAQSLGRRPSPDQMKQVGQEFWTMHQAGIVPSGDQAFQAFYGVMMEFGKLTDDPEPFEVGLKAMKEKFGHIARAKAFFDQQEQVLEQLKQKAAGK